MPTDGTLTTGTAVDLALPSDATWQLNTYELVRFSR